MSSVQAFSRAFLKKAQFTPEILYTVFVLIHQDDSNIFKGGHHHENVTGNQEFSGVSRTQFKKNTIQNYRYFLAVFQKQFGRRDVSEVTPDEIMEFLVKITEGLKPSTKKLKYSLLKSLFNFVKNTAVPDLSNPCDSAVLSKTFRVSKLPPWTILERDAVDEFIFKTESPRNRLMLELMARGGMRIGEVLKLKPRDVQDRKLHLPNPKSGRTSEVVFIPQKVADRLRDYIAAENILDDKRIFPMGYTRAREIVKSAGNKIGIDVKPHDLRRHAATYASRSGVPIEIVSKIILRHSNLATTQRYLGKISDTEAMYWIENIYR